MNKMEKQATKDNDIKIELADSSVWRGKRGATPLQILEATGKAGNRSLIMAIYNGRRVDLRAPLKRDGHLTFCPLKSPEGIESFRRGITMLISLLIREISPGARLVVEHSLNRGLYCEFSNLTAALRPAIIWLKGRISEMIKEDIPFEYRRFSRNEVKNIFKEQGEPEKSKILSNLDRTRIVLYGINGYWELFTGPLPPSTGYLAPFRIKSYAPGLIVNFGAKMPGGAEAAVKDQKNLFQLYSEHGRWGKILEVDDAGDLNRHIENKGISEIIKIAEALHEKKIAQIADSITKNLKQFRLFMISGPSSSGKTTFSKRLMIQLRVNGLKPVILNLDDYFVDRSKTPLNGDGEYDFETPEALDLELFNHDVETLMLGGEIDIPSFSFTEGKRLYKGKKLSLAGRRQPILVEGIHGLNENIASCVPPEQKFHIYISALTTLNINNLNRIPTSDNRLIRRIVRDNLFRSYSARETLSRWPLVRTGEAKYIFSFQENADVIFNSALLYELAVFKKYADPLLRDIQPNEEEYPAACRLLEILDIFLPISPDEVPPTSILREFVGGSSFNY